VILRQVDTGVLKDATYGDITLGATASAADLLAVSVNGAMVQRFPNIDIVTLPGPIIPFRYESRVMQGIWAAAPYLHNGSVASLEELLKPSAERMKSFQVGPAYDSQTVGLARSQPQGKRYLRETTDCGNIDSGNSNCGHEFGTTLNPADKKALLVVLQGDIYGFRATEPCQCKAPLAGNGVTLVKSGNTAMVRLGGSLRAR
jgi:hypothetical protein